MSTTSQSDNDTQSPPARVSQATRVPRSNTAQLRNHRGNPYPPPLPRQLANRTADRTSGSPSPDGSPAGPQSAPAPAVGTVRHFGRPGGGVVRRWPPTVVPFETSEASFDDEYIDLLGRTYDLRAPYMGFAEELVQVPSSRQFSVLLYSMLSVRQAVESLLQTRDAAQIASTGTLAIPLSVQARIFPYQKHFKTFVQTRAKEVLMSPTLDVYSCDPVRGAPPAGRSLLDQVLEHVINQSDEFKLDYLPVGFLSGDLAARGSLNTELRERLKHERGNMRNLLLTMVHDPSGRSITHPVPNLTSLIIDMTQRMIPGVERAAAHAANRRLRSRIAHLRIQTISHYARRGGGESNRQWSIIDEQLVDLRARPALYRRAFYKLIVQLDAAMFGEKLYADMDVEKIKTPTEEEVLAQMDLMAQERLNATEANNESGEE